MFRFFFHIGNSQDANLILIAQTDISIFLVSKPKETKKNSSIFSVCAFIYVDNGCVFFHLLYIVQPLCTLLYLFGVLFHCAVVIRLYGWCGNLVCHSGRCRCNFFPHQMCSNLLLQLLLHTHTYTRWKNAATPAFHIPSEFYNSTLFWFYGSLLCFINTVNFVS